MTMSNKYAGLLKPLRRRTAQNTNRTPIEEFYNDRSRIIYSSSFRRLQQKAQVFSLEANSSVRTRLTHSIEVSDVGRALALRIAEGLRKAGHIDSDTVPQIVAIVENACLLHDIGNPPFGHFGEAAIKKWMHLHLPECILEAQVGLAALSDLLQDFYEFDGNPQGFRTITRLHCEKDQYGLNLSFPTLLTVIKYPCNPIEVDKSIPLKKKAGYFYSEEDIVNEILGKIPLEPGKRYPFAYIMEAADDIAYSLSDICDGIKKHIITQEGFLVQFDSTWHDLYRSSPIPAFWNEGCAKKEFNDMAAYWSSHMVEAAVAQYLNEEDRFFSGQSDSLISKDSEAGRVLKAIKTVSRKLLYRSSEAEDIELSGYSIITGLLDGFGTLLRLPYRDFKLLTGEGPSGPEGKNLDYEWRIYNRLSKRCKDNYIFQRHQLEEKGTISNELEWWLRVHMILDYISGMTDEYALSVYQMMKGIRI